MRRVAAGIALLFTLAAWPGLVESAVPGVAELQVATASDLRFALAEISTAFQRQHHAQIRITLGSSVQLSAQIQQGAPFDVFFSADEALVHYLADKGAVVRDSIRLYAIGRIAIWVRSDSPIDVGPGLGALTDPRVRYVAIANPQHAPYGRAAEQALRSAGVYERVRAKLVLGENISQALQYVQTGNADAGIVALSLAVAPPVKPTGRFWVIPSSFHRPIRQAVALTTRSAQPALAASFVAFVNSPAGRAIMRRYGFTLPGEAL